MADKGNPTLTPPNAEGTSAVDIPGISQLNAVSDVQITAFVAESTPPRRADSPAHGRSHRSGGSRHRDLGQQRQDRRPVGDRRDTQRMCPGRRTRLAQALQRP